MCDMQETSSGFGDESPILFRPSGRLYLGNVEYLDNLHKEILLHLKKSKTIPKQELKSYLNTVTQMQTTDHKSRWLVMKIKGLLNYILKKRAAFQQSIIKGEITIYQKSVYGPNTPSQFLPIKDNSFSCNSSMDIPLNLLSNNNFISTEATRDNSNKMETESNYSQDLFSDVTQSLHNFSQENFHLLKNLAQNSDTHDDKVFKVPAVIPKVEKACKLHESLEESFNIICSSIPLTAQTDENMKVEERPPEIKNESNIDVDISPNTNIFDNAKEIAQKLIEEMQQEYEEIDKLLRQVIDNLIDLNLRETPNQSIISDNSKNNISVLSDRSNLRLRTYHSEENLKIIRETCAKFKENMKQRQNNCRYEFE